MNGNLLPGPVQVKCGCLGACGGDISKCDGWECLTCGNTTHRQGFYPCDWLGNIVDPTPELWPRSLYVCDKCGAIIAQENGQKVGQRQ